jgi:hypothetical protein
MTAVFWGASADWRWIESGTGLPTRELETMGQETHATELETVPNAHATSDDRQLGAAPGFLSERGCGAIDSNFGLITNRPSAPRPIPPN